MQRSVWWAVLVGGLVGGTLDILFAISFGAYNGIPAMRLLQSVASGLLGRDAYSGGAPTAALGLTLHFAMAIAFAGAFVLASRRLPLLVRRPYIFGGLFGMLQTSCNDSGSVVPCLPVRHSDCVGSQGGLAGAPDQSIAGRCHASCHAHDPQAEAGCVQNHRP
jgi:hypothetical protein